MVDEIKNKKELKQFYILMILLTLSYVPISYDNKNFECKMLNSSRYYVCTVIKPTTTRGSRTVIISFNKNYIKNKIEVDYIGNEPLTGNKYILAYVENKKYGRMFTECLLNDTILQPANGWDKLPYKDLQSKVDNYYSKILNFGVKKYLPDCK